MVDPAYALHHRACCVTYSHAVPDFHDDPLGHVLLDGAIVMPVCSNMAPGLDRDFTRA
jgi:hypothetical protein